MEFASVEKEPNNIVYIRTKLPLLNKKFNSPPVYSGFHLFIRKGKGALCFCLSINKISCGMKFGSLQDHSITILPGNFLLHRIPPDKKFF